MKTYTTFFNEIRPGGIETAGGKGASLASLFKAGFNVPAGFCISTQAFNDFVVEKGILSFIKEQGFIPDTSNKTMFGISKNIREKILKDEIPQTIKEDITRAFRQLTENGVSQVAVRSSAILEDTAKASFAGQYDSFLNIDSEKELLDSVKKCWASLWTRRVMEYRIENGFGLEEESIAVVVQQMVEAESSGVVFTVNPVNKKPNEIVINAVSGLGEKLVSGKANADFIIVDKETAEIIRYQSPNQNQSLDKKHIKQLLTAAKDIEKFCNAPQDIEWALSKDKIFIIQARPITTLKDDEEEEHWTAENAQEACPTVVSPFSSEFMTFFLNDTFLAIAKMFGVNEKLEFGKAIDGYFYLNLNTIKKLMAKLLPGADGDAMIGQLLGEDNQSGIKIKFGLPMLKFVPTLIKSSYYITMLPRRYPKMLKRFEEDNPLANLDYKHLDKKELLNFHDLSDRFSESSDYMFYMLYGGLAYGIFFGELTKIIKSLPEGLNISPSVFFTDLDTLDDARSKKDFQKLAEEAKKGLKICNLILKEDPEILTSIIRGKPEMASFVKSFDNFLGQYGYMGENMLDLASPRWIEDQSSIWKMMKSYLSAETVVSKKMPDKTEAKKAVEQWLSKQSKFLPVKKWRFQIILKLAIKYVPYRENFRFHLTKWLFPIRQLILHEGKLLKEDGYLKETGDIFFLKKAEIEAALADAADKNELQNKVLERRADYLKWKDTKPPCNVFIKGSRICKVYDLADKDAKTLKGVAASGGTVTGKARLITKISESDKLKKGEILVTKFTDPAWTPLFSVAEAVVVDIGSMLSHAAIIAREVGIPAVMGVRHGTEVIKDGQEITVDGTKGIVKIS